MSANDTDPKAIPSEAEGKDDSINDSNTTTEVSSKPTTLIDSTNTGLTKKDYEVMSKIVKYLTEYKNEDDEEIAGAFQRIVDKRNYPDYWEIIKEPIAFSTIRGKITKKQYKDYKEFVRDFARIWHNAQVYNRPSAGVYQVAVTLRELFKQQLQKLVDDKIITADVAELPYLGELPEVEPSPPPGPEDEEVDDEDEDEDEDEEDDESDDDRPRKGRRKGRRSSAVARREGKLEDTSKDDPEAQKKRGRPPKVHTPMEARINTLLKGLRKFKNPGGDLKILHFEKMPDKTTMPEYYHEIKTPIAMDIIKRKAKRKKYQSVDQALKDLELMFDNAKSYNLEESQVYKDAVDLQREARLLAEQEKKKPDSDFVDEDGRLPLTEILYEGELWKVGDWVHLSNSNDVTKPIVAQIYRTWQDPEGQKWINACWYYRPEQTVHRYEKHFFENEVVKTGQYRDHKIEEVVDRCFVMFFTRYHKGRPRGFPADKEVYVCEARYNEEKFKLNKIKTWASCVPDEVREKDYEMDLFDAPRKMKKVPSPIKHLLREDAKEDDPLPKPTWGQPNAPPIVGAVHRRPREANESPPPEPTPSPPPTPEPVRHPSTTERPRFESQGDAAMSGSTISAALPSPSPAPTSSQTTYGQQFGNVRPSASPAPLVHQASFSSHGSNQPTAQPSSIHPSRDSYNQYATASTPFLHQQTSQSNYGYQSNQVPRQSTTSNSQQGHNMYNPPRVVETYVLGEVANASMPADIRAQFHRDDLDRVIFFTNPPLNAIRDVGDRAPVKHSLRYLAFRARRKDDLKRKRETNASESYNQPTGKKKRGETECNLLSSTVQESYITAMTNWSNAMDSSTDELYKQLYGSDWRQNRYRDTARLAGKQSEEMQHAADLVMSHRASAIRKEVDITGFRWL